VRLSTDYSQVPGSLPLAGRLRMVEAALARGVTVERVFSGTRLAVAKNATVQLDPLDKLSRREHIRILSNIESVLPLNTLLPDNETPFSIASYGMLGYAMMSRRTLKGALEIALKYYRTAGPLCSIQFIETANFQIVEAQNTYLLSATQLQFVIEELFSSFPALLQALLGKQVDTRRVEFEFPCPEEITTAAVRYHNWFDCDPSFDCSSSRYYIDASELQRSLVGADENAAALFEQSCQKLMKEIEEAATLSGRVQTLMLGLPVDQMNADTIAKKLNMGVRTLRRRLEREQSSFQQLLDIVKASLARDYLATTDLSVQEIAELVGFSEATNFRRAFIRWTSTSPSRYRANLR